MPEVSGAVQRQQNQINHCAAQPRALRATRTAAQLDAQHYMIVRCGGARERQRAGRAGDVRMPALKSTFKAPRSKFLNGAVRVPAACGARGRARGEPAGARQRRRDAGACPRRASMQRRHPPQSAAHQGDWFQHASPGGLKSRLEQAKSHEDLFSTHIDRASRSEGSKRNSAVEPENRNRASTLGASLAYSTVC